MYKDWIISRLPSGIPADVISYVEKQIDANFGGYISGLQYWAFGERGPDELIYTAENEDDLKLWMFREAARSIAQRMELTGRAEEENRWRYVRDHVEDGVWIYRENQQYQFNAIHDSRKFWMEYELRLLYPVFPEARWMQRVEYYENYMNKKFQVKHWSYDTTALCFREVSDSKEIDIYGVQQPAEGSIMQGRISVGLDSKCILTFTSEDFEETLTSLGDETAQGETVYYFGDYTLMSNKYIIPYEQAVEAIKVSVDTGKLSKSIKWTDKLF